jgi:hypothetical protein
LPTFINAQEFEQTRSRGMAMDVDFSTRNAIVDSRGNVLAYAQTGGVISPSRHELNAGAVLFRFGGAGVAPATIASGT